MPCHHCPCLQKGCRGICQLLDYGLADGAYWLVMRRYRCTLSDWRSKQRYGAECPTAVHLYLGVLLQVRGGVGEHLH